jgi:hypothetical protein
MDRAGLERGLRNGAIGANDQRRSMALPAMARGTGDDFDEQHLARLRRRSSGWAVDASELDSIWQGGLAVNDADIDDDFGDFCGRRVA